jgi:REP element-mobilizing transposase RayT
VTRYDPDRHHRRSIRLKGYDYTLNGAYFITVVVQDRLCLFGEVVEGAMQLNDAGRMIASEWFALPLRFPTVQLDAFVVMPNHTHGVILIDSVGAPLVGAQLKDPPHVGAPLVGARSDRSPGNTKATTRVAPTPSLDEVIGAYKSLTTVEFVRGVNTLGWSSFPGKLWQRNYYEHIIRNEDDLQRIRQYIADNPACWAEDPENPVGAPLVGAQSGDTRATTRVAPTIFDSVIVVTDRKVLDKQIRDTIKQFAQVAATVGHAERSGDLRRFLESGKKIIITTVQKFPFVLDEIGNEHRGRQFAILIDEAHSSQGGRTAAQMNIALSSEGGEEEGETTEDAINRIMEARKMLPNASYFAFTATPKNKTLEVFGEPWSEGGAIKHRPFHSYTMKQAIQERFIEDVLKNYTPVESYYRLIKAVEDDPEFDTKKAQKKLRRYVESHAYAIRQKAEIMVDHFHEQVLAKHKIGGQARAMVVTSSIERAIHYFFAIRDYLKERKSPYEAIVAFSGEHEHGGQRVTEASLNGC